MQDVGSPPVTAGRFARVIESRQPAPALEGLRWSSFYELLFGGESTGDILVGELDGTELSLGVEELRRSYGQVCDWADAQGIEPGETIALIRLEGASELPLAVAALAMMAAGYRVFLPMGFDAAYLSEMLKRVGATALCTCTDERPDDLQRQSQSALDEICDTLQIPGYCLRRDVDIFGADDRDSEAPALDIDREVVVFSTSGTTGAPKLVAFTERALLTGAQAWEDAGLLDEERLGGPTLVPLLSHTMGFRHVLHALWKRQPALFIRPEWLETRPYRVVSLLLGNLPNHVTCGPALLSAYFEYMRHFPVLREKLEPQLRCIVSSGTAYAAGTNELFAESLFANAYGTTETQQVLNTLLRDVTDLEEGQGAGDLGLPLPGVRIGIDEEGKLFVSSPFGGAGYIDETGETQPFEDWHDTGDLVTVDGALLHYSRRALPDFLNTGVGVKVARRPLEMAYENLLPEVQALLIEAPTGRTGLVALAFVDGDADCPKLQERLVESAAARRQQLAADGHDLDFGKVPVEAIGVVSGRPPLRGPGKLDRQAARAANWQLLQALSAPDVIHPHVVEVPEDPESLKQRFSYPRLGRLIEALRLDVDYESGSGNILMRSTPKGPREVLDMTGGYGANLLGHGRHELLTAATKALGKVPMLDQVSGRRKTDEFAAKLALRVGKETGRRWIVVLASTGAEAVDLSLKHAAAVRTRSIEELHRRLRRQFGASQPGKVEKIIAENTRILESRRPVIVALKSGFHGKTVGAMHVLSHDRERTVFSPFLAADTVFLDPEGSPEARRRLAEVVEVETLKLGDLRRDEDGSVRAAEFPFSNLLATVAEPILGEGGIIEVPHDWLAMLKVEGVPFIVDEIQSGLGRAGSFLASTDPETRAVAPADCILLGKSLGGGVAKLSALLIARSHYLEHFDEWRGSTYGEDSFSSAVGMEVLELIDRDDVAGLSRRAGESLCARLQEVQEAYPRVITAIRGRGVMIGVELCYPNDPPSTMLRAFARRGLGYLAASYLLHRHDLRILPTTSAPSVLRLEPSAYLRSDESEKVAAALQELARALDTSNAFELLSHLVDGAAPDIEQKREIARYSAGTEATTPRWIQRQEPAEGAIRVAFVHHPMHPSKEMIADAPLTALFSTEQRLELGDLLQLASEFEPLMSFSRNFYEDKIWMAGITVPASPLMMEYFYRNGDTDLIVDRLQEAVALADELGCEAITFGGFTSIVSDDATLLSPVGDTQLSSGNTFTAAVTLHHLKRSCDEQDVDFSANSTIKVAVIGALGNIGQALAELLAVYELPNAELTLFGRKGSNDRLRDLRDQLVAERDVESPDASGTIALSTDLDDVQSADLVVVAVNSAEPILFARHIGDGRPVIIADVSQPRATSDEVENTRPSSHFVDGGVVHLPKDGDFLLSLDAPAGTLYACAAEALLMGLCDMEMELTGQIKAENIRRLYSLGEEWGFFK